MVDSKNNTVKKGVRKMTEKRFIIADDYAILDSTQNNEIGKGIYVAQDPVEATKLCKLLNELAEENQQCKEYNAKLYSNSMKSEKQLLKQIKELKEENKELQEFKDKVFNLIDKTIESETQIAENIESTIEGDYVIAVNRLTIIAFENLKKELSK